MSWALCPPKSKLCILVGNKEHILMSTAKYSSVCKDGSNLNRIITACNRGENLIGKQLARRSNPRKSNINWAYIYIYIYIRTYAYICIYTYVYIYMRTHTHAHTRTYVSMHIYTRTHTYIHTNICKVFNIVRLFFLSYTPSKWWPQARPLIKLQILRFIFNLFLHHFFLSWKSDCI